MAFPIRREEDGTNVCLRCSGETLCVNEEQVDDLAGLPLARKYLWTSRCKGCGMAFHRKSEKMVRERMGKSARIRPWLLGTHSLVVVMVILIGGSFALSHHQQATYAATPIVGDTWTVTAEKWPIDDVFQNTAKYGRVRVSSVDDSMIGLEACNTTSDGKDDIEKYCKTYPVDIDGVPRSELERMWKDDVIERVDTARRDNRPLYIAWGAFGALLLGYWLVCRRWKARITLPEF